MVPPYKPNSDWSWGKKEGNDWEKTGSRNQGEKRGNLRTSAAEGGIGKERGKNLPHLPLGRETRCLASSSRKSGPTSRGGKPASSRRALRSAKTMRDERAGDRNLAGDLSTREAKKISLT